MSTESLFKPITQMAFQLTFFGQPDCLFTQVLTEKGDVAFVNPQVGAAIVAGVVALVTALGTALVTISLGEQRLRRDFGLEFAAERVAHQSMQDPEWRLRSFEVIKSHLAGFEDDELRRTLVRAGAIRFESPSGKELWGLLERVPELLGGTTVPWEPKAQVTD